MSIALHYSYRQIDNHSPCDTEQIPEDSIEQVYLKCCDLVTFPDWLTGLQNLTHLNISSNAIEQVPDALKFLVNLNYLDLSENRLTNELSTAILQLSNLRYLDVAGNYIESIPPGEDDKAENISLTFMIIFYF